MRMFAGPNGSGKSTLKSYLSPALIGVYLNPDDLEREIVRHGFLDFSAYDVTTTADEVLKFFNGSAFLKEAGLGEAANKLQFADGRLKFERVEVNSYFASVAVEFLRQKLLAQKETFTFETVMSHPGKVELLAQAQAAGYRTYLYFVATDDPAINISRVKNRVKLNGHDVPEERIAPRYHRSLDLLMTAIRHTNRAYIFDNSTYNADLKHTWLAEITDGRKLELKTDRIPAWFKRAVLDKISSGQNPPV
jgi:predicted ABC-type ATPase